MKTVFIEYGTYITGLVAFTFFLLMMTLFKGEFKKVSTDFISTMTGADASYVGETE